MAFINPIMTNHVTKIIDQPLMNSIIAKRYISIDAENPKGGYHKPFVVIAKIHYHKNCHLVRPNKVALKYLDFLKKC
jgi:hypothetical protein